MLAYQEVHQDNILNLEENLNNKIFGQSHIIKEVVESIYISLAKLSDDSKPQASFLFTGATGTGKTELAKELAKQLKKDFIRFDMSEYSDKSSIRNLSGSAKGLVGYEEGGLLTNAILDKPNSIILFDEVEKAHKSIFTLFLQILDYATLTDTLGNKVDFSNTIIIMTSNLGIKENNTFIGFNNNTKEFSPIDKEAIKEFFTPELRARLDKILYFNPISSEIIYNIIDKFLDQFIQNLLKKNIHLLVTDKAKEKLYLLWETSDKEGARTLYKIINTQFKQHIAKEILFGGLTQGGSITIDIKDDEFIYNYTHMYFKTSQEACSYAKKHIGTVITRATDDVGYIVLRKESTIDNI